MQKSLSVIPFRNPVACHLDNLDDDNQQDYGDNHHVGLVVVVTEPDSQVAEFFPVPRRTIIFVKPVCSIFDFFILLPLMHE
jgi:hypothetical protein